MFASQPLWIQIFGEMLGTLILVLLGNGCCFAVSHKRMFANQPGKWVIVVLGWAIGIFLGAFASTALGGPGHINPAVSIMEAFKPQTTAGTGYEALAFIPMQFIGAALGQGLLYAMNWPFIQEELNGGDITATRGASATNPAYQKSYASNFLYEFIGTAVLLFAVMMVGQASKEPSSVLAGLSPLSIFIVSTTVLGIGCSLGSATGFALNPARDLAPRLVYQVLRTATGNKLEKANWSYSWIPVAAPILAALIFGGITVALS